MLETILKLYITAMAGDVRSPTPHLFGPPGCGKSTVVEEAAKLLGVNLHTINVSRLSPLELEGVQMPDKEHAVLNLLTATYWTKLKDGDIILLDEFLRGFPEVYNGLLDIMTARNVAGYVLPKVFIIAASNSTVAYDKALDDRLLHLPVPDPRKQKGEQKRLAKMFCDICGFGPATAVSYEMDRLFQHEINPMFAILDTIGHKGSIGAASYSGHSIRNLTGQVRLRQIQSVYLHELIVANNVTAINQSHYQYVVLPDGKNPNPKYVSAMEKLGKSANLTEIQRQNLNINLQLIQLEHAKQAKMKGSEEEDEDL